MYNDCTFAIPYYDHEMFSEEKLEKVEYDITLEEKNDNYEVAEVNHEERDNDITLKEKY